MPGASPAAPSPRAFDALMIAAGFAGLYALHLLRDRLGLHVRVLAEAWTGAGGEPRTLLGLAIAGFPNRFTVTGPGSPSVRTNMPVAIEQHVEWIAGAIAWMRANAIARMKAEKEETTRWTRHVDEVANATLYPRAASSWYLGVNIFGKPPVFMPYFGALSRYRAICDEVAASGYLWFRRNAARGGSAPGGEALREHIERDGRDDGREHRS